MRNYLPVERITLLHIILYANLLYNYIILLLYDNGRFRLHYTRRAYIIIYADMKYGYGADGQSDKIFLKFK